MESKKNILIIILVVIIAVLCLIIGILLGSNFNSNNESLANNDIQEDNIMNQEKIQFIGDKNKEVTYNPSYAKSYNLNYKIDESGQLVFTDLNNQNNTITYNSINEKSKYIVMSIPHGKQEAYYHIAVITEDGNVFYKMFYAFADLNSEDNLSQYASNNDNFIKLENNVKFNGLHLKNNLSGFENIIISSEDGKEYYVTDGFKLEEFNK